MAEEKFTNIIGVPFKDYVSEQLKVRALNLSQTGQRTEDNILFLANKNCWIKLTSFVTVEGGYAGNLSESTPQGTFLAENWTLFGGTSYLNKNTNPPTNNLRYGIEENPTILNDPYLSITNNSAYGLGGVSQQGYKIMPGITSAKIQHMGAAGSLRSATVNFYVGNKQQLDIIDMLYFRLGYSCLLEWGHTSYLDNKGKLESNIYPIDIFDTKNIQSKEDVLFKINEKKQETNGNYDAMYGMVGNYEWNLNVDGGYDCNLKLMGLGSVIDSLKINQSFSMPNGSYKGATQNKTNGSTQQAGTAITNISIPKGPVIEKNQIIYGQIGESYQLDGSETVRINYDELLGAASGSNFVYSYLVKNISNGNSLAKPVGKTPTNIASVNYNGELLLQKELPSSKKCLLSKTAGKFKVYDPDDKVDINLNSFTTVDFANTNQSSPVDIIEDSAFKIELIDNKKIIKLTNDLQLKEPKEFVYQSGELGTDKVPTYSTATCNTLRVIYEIPYDIFNKNINIVYPPYSNKSKALLNLDPEGNRISFPALTNFYYNYLTGPYKNLTQPLKYDDGSLQVILNNIKPTNKDNVLDISVDLTITDTKSRTAATRVQQTKAFIDSIFEGIQSTSINNKDLYNITQLTSDNDFASKNYEGNNLKKTFTIARIVYSYDATKFNNPSNTEDSAPEEDLAAPAATLPTTVMSNIDKFLIELRDEAAARGTGGGKIDLYDFIRDKMSTGVLDKMRVKTENEPIPLLRSEIPTDPEKRLGYFIKKGFNSEVISGEKSNVGQVPNVDFRELFTAYYAGIIDNQDQGLTSKYIYIKLGLLLYYINNSSVLYEKNDNTDTKPALKRPFVYIDFNPETNFCLTTKFHFSVDPSVCLIPVNISPDGYKKLFPNIQINDNEIFKTSLDNVSRFINTGFSDKGGLDQSRAKIMNIGVNIDHAINILQSQAKSNPESNVYLRPFIETLVADINKSLGNINKFRVGYYDDGNTVRIYDDQYVNPSSGQTTITTDTPTLDAIPIFGKNSIARNITLKTGVSTAMSNQIAISSQAGNLGALNVDASSFGNINSRLLDRLMRVKEEAANPATTGSVSPADESSAAIFNDHLVAVYNRQENNISNAEIAKNYYCTVANKLKANLPSTSIKPVLPLELNVTTDGISGMSLLEGFIIPTDLLPMQYLTQGKSKVGFAIMGLDHSIEGNQWTTNIKGQMINLPNPARVLSSELGVAEIGVGGASPKTSSNFVYVEPGPPVPIGANPLLKNQAFLDGVGRIARKYGFNPEEMLKCFHAESGITTTAANRQGKKGVTSGPNRYRLVAAGLMQWTTASGVLNYKSTRKFGVTNLEQILTLSPLQQLEMADEYFANSRTYINRMSPDERNSFFGLYLLVFYPVFAGQPDTAIAQNSKFTAKQISEQNGGIAKAAGKKPGDPLTKGDFRKYCAKTFNVKLPAGLKFNA
jgi:hypothetical protein